MKTLVSVLVMGTFLVHLTTALALPKGNQSTISFLVFYDLKNFNYKQRLKMGRKWSAIMGRGPFTVQEEASST